MKFNLSIQNNLPHIDIDKTIKINSDELVLILLFLSNGGFFNKFQELLIEKLSKEDFEFVMNNLAALDSQVKQMTNEMVLEEAMTPIIGSQIFMKDEPPDDGSLQ